MGKIDNTKLYSICGGLVLGLGLLFALLLNSKTSSFLSSKTSTSYNQADKKSMVGRNALHKISTPKTKWRKINDPKNFRVKRYDSNYTPTSTYANTYVPSSGPNYPLVASTKFIKKKNKDKEKTKKKGSKGSLARNKSGKSRYKDDGTLDPLSESPSSSPSAVSFATGSSNAKTAKKDKAEEEENINTVEFWEQPIFVEADPLAVNKLIDSFQVKKVSSSVFYSVVTQMNEDSRTEIREMGVVALGSTPSSQSYAQLTWVKHNDSTPEIRNEAGRYIASYTDVSKLGYVVAALRNSEDSPKVAIESMRTLTESTKRYSDLQALHADNPKKAPAVDYTSLEPRYSSALELLEQNYVNSSDAAVKSEATRAMAAISKFITI